MTELADGIRTAVDRAESRMALVEQALEQVATHLGAWDGSDDTKQDAAATIAHRVATAYQPPVDETLILLDGETIGTVRGSWDGLVYTAKLTWVF